jgi:hypothetical protein
MEMSILEDLFSADSRGWDKPGQSKLSAGAVVEAWLVTQLV